MITNGSFGTLTGSGTIYSGQVTPNLGATVSVSVPAGAATDATGNGNQGSDVFTVQSGSPVSEFERYSAEIRRIIIDDAVGNLRSTLGANQRMVRGARERFIDQVSTNRACAEFDDGNPTAIGAELPAECDNSVVSRDDVPFDVDGRLTVAGTTLSTSGTFFGQSGSLDGQSRRLVFGDFDIQHDGETGSSTATLTGRIAWERLVSERTMLGYFVGGVFAQSNIAGAFEGDNRRLGLTLGGYSVHELRENLFADGVLTFGAGRNNLAMANDILGLAGC